MGNKTSTPGASGDAAEAAQANRSQHAVQASRERPHRHGWAYAAPYLCAIGSGLLLAAADHPWHAWPLVAVAFVPIFFAFVRFEPTWRSVLLMGALFGIAYTGPVLAALHFPLAFAVPLGAVTTIVWGLILSGIRPVVRLGPARSCIAAGALVALIEWANVTCIPVWGTAQSFVRTWSAEAWPIQVVSLTGVTGLAFLLVFNQMLLVRTIATNERRTTHLMALGASVLLYIVFSLVRARDEPSRSLRVAAYGWAEPDDDPAAWTQTASAERIGRQYAPSISEASRRGARLLVFPEVGLFVDGSTRSAAIGQLATLARTHGIALVIGLFDRAKNQNESLIIASDGTEAAPYVKSHLIPFVESYRAGAGAPTEALVDGTRVGTMICQDDNFTDVAREYGRLATPLVAVPTNDWRDVARVHFDNSLFRPVENGYGLVRAAHNGISAIVSPRGKVLAARDHFRDGAGVVVADVPLGDSTTVYARWGRFVPILWIALFVLALGGRGGMLWATRRPSR